MATKMKTVGRSWRCSAGAEEYKTGRTAIARSRGEREVSAYARGGDGTSSTNRGDAGVDPGRRE